MILAINAIFAIVTAAALISLLTWSIRSSIRRPQLAEIRLLPIAQPTTVVERWAA